MGHARPHVPDGRGCYDDHYAHWRPTPSNGLWKGGGHNDLGTLLVATPNAPTQQCLPGGGQKRAPSHTTSKQARSGGQTTTPHLSHRTPVRPFGAIGRMSGRTMDVRNPTPASPASFFLERLHAAFFHARAHLFSFFFILVFTPDNMDAMVKTSVDDRCAE